MQRTVGQAIAASSSSQGGALETFTAAAGPGEQQAAAEGTSERAPRRTGGPGTVWGGGPEGQGQDQGQGPQRKEPQGAGNLDLQRRGDPG